MKYDYELQVWYNEATTEIKPCAHPASMRIAIPCCHAWEYRHCTLELARRAEAAKANISHLAFNRERGTYTFGAAARKVA